MHSSVGPSLVDGPLAERIRSGHKPLDMLGALSLPAVSSPNPSKRGRPYVLRLQGRAWRADRLCIVNRGPDT